MTVDETAEILTFLRGCYPAFYRRTSADEAEAALTAWSVLFADASSRRVMEAVKDYVSGRYAQYDPVTNAPRKTDHLHFPPPPGLIAEILNRDRSLRKYVRALAAEYAALSEADRAALSAPPDPERDLLSDPERDTLPDPERNLLSYPERDALSYPERDALSYPERNALPNSAYTALPGGEYSLFSESPERPP